MVTEERPGPGSIWGRYERFFRAAPEIVFEWNDSETSARGWLVINSLKGGAAGGGTRMHSGLTRDEVTFLAKAMELKFAFAGPIIGGAKSGIDFDPADGVDPVNAGDTITVNGAHVEPATVLVTKGVAVEGTAIIAAAAPILREAALQAG